MRVYDQGSDIYFGRAEDKDVVDWRKAEDGDVADDDEELDETPADVIAMLGFDPKDL